MFKNIVIKLARLQLKSYLPSQRRKAIRTLSTFSNDPSILIDLQKALHDTERSVRYEVICALQSFTLSPDIKEAIKYIITTEHDWSMCSRAMDLLEDDTDPSFVPVFIQTAQSEDLWIAIKATAILGKHKDPSTLPILQSALHASEHCMEYDEVRAEQEQERRSGVPKDSISQVAQAEGMYNWKMEITILRTTAAQALGALGNPEAIPDLICALYDTHPTAVPKEAARALEQIGTDEALAAVSVWHTRQNNQRKNG